MFATRVWGYDPKIFPIASFGSEGLCNHLLKKSSLGDRLVFVGTKGPPTHPNEQGKILGYIEFGRDVVNTLDVSSKEAYPAEAFERNGNLKWPRALVATRAWSINLEPLPDLVETIGRQFTRDATTMAVDLSEGEAAKILELPMVEVSVPEGEVLMKLRRRNERLAPKGRSKGPNPSSREGGGYELGNSAWTYAMQFGDRPCFKVGWSTDPKRRLGEVNKHVPSELLKEEWSLLTTHKWENENLAHKMEQAILDAFPPKKISGERVNITIREFEQVWNDYLAGTIT